jgi:branched-chain amino acid transport system ATP-binding protein
MKMETTNTQPILEVTHLTKYFGGLCAVKDFDLTLHSGDLFGLIGPNGAGKTTVFNLITGLYQVSSGNVKFQGEPTVGFEPHEITRMGIARTFQNIRLFQNLTVLDNVRIAYHTHSGYSLADSILRNQRFTKNEKELTERARDFLAIFKLENILNEQAKNLPYGEPAAGMNPKEISQLMDLIHFVRDRFNLTILLIEHQMRFVMGICQYITVMDFGEVIARGNPKEIQDNEKVIEAYLGRGAVHAA